MKSVVVAPHPLLEPVWVQCCFPKGLSQESSPGLIVQLELGADVPMTVGEGNKKAVRDLLRYGGFKPAGRSKPACEYLIKAAESGFLGPINPAVDACNVVSLHSGLPISVVDLQRVSSSLSVEVAAPDTHYVFNASGQIMDISGLVCLRDSEGPCANAVKDSQRSKTHAGTQSCLFLIWGTRDLPKLADQAGEWLEALLRNEGATGIERWATPVEVPVPA
jgi:DNA/RNA-binding domain of Phe-tRNA-synthetase-like protein